MVGSEAVSVVVSAYSKERLDCVLECVNSVRNQSFPPKEIILVLDPDRQLMEAYQSRVPSYVKIIASEGFGLSNARNAGVKSAQGEIVAFIDDDAVADVNWLKNLVRNYDDSNVVGVGGAINPLWENGCPAWFPEELNWVVGCSYKGLPEQKALVRNPIGCNMSFRKDVLMKVGLFRSDIGRFGKRLLAGEETELSLRILSKIKGSKIIYDPAAKVYHRVSKNRVTPKYLWGRSFCEGVSKALITSRSPALSAENKYLKYLIEVTVPSKLRHGYRFGNLCQLLVLACSTCAVFVGFSLTRISRS
ncbi:MAG: glycosyltransferase family 2 protein [Candidatus Bathyarchaeia archaeon]|jgi:glycosyltransferase involved in cell wall biosynthesis|nr:glycosyltransferase [Candidatus Bathyarchaeota archaeon A05DMB-4]